MPPIIHCINHEFCGGYASQFPGLCLACALRARKLARQRRGCLGILFRLHEWSIRRKQKTVRCDGGMDG